MFGSFRRKKVETAPPAVSHIAFIMDGNGRWAKRRGLPREAGHRAGAKTFSRIVEHCIARGVPTVTVYAFSTENWRRPKREVDAIMELLDRYIEDTFSRYADRDVEIVFIGRRDGLSPSLLEKMERLENESRGRKTRVNIALNYGGRDEIVRAVNRLAEEGKLPCDEASVSAALDTAGRPDPDLVVRTGGDVRTSNFLLWESAYAEYFFTGTLWPDFNERELDRILSDYARRHRRFGGL